MQLHITKYGYLAHRQFSPKARQLFITCLILFCFISVQGQTIIVAWNFEDKDRISDGGIPVNLDSEITSTSESTINYVSGSGGSGTYSTNNINWDNGQNLKYWQIVFSTQGYKNLNLSSKQYSSNTGPRDFKVQYSTDGTLWTDLGATITIAANFTKGVLKEFDLPVQCDDQPMVCIRWIMNTNIAVNGSNVGSSGSNRIDDILIKGCLMPVMTSPLAHSCCSGSPVNYSPEGSATIYQWNRSSTEGIAEGASSGLGPINEVLTNTTNLPVNVDYTYNLDLEGCTTSQIVAVSVNPTPDLLVNPTSLNVCPEAGGQTLSFSNPNQIPETTFHWEWTGLNSDCLTITPSSGNSSPINFSILNNIPSVLTETTISIVARTIQGCSTNQLVSIFSGDHSPPIFCETINSKNLCVQDIFAATSNGSDDITEPRPDYYLFTPHDNVFDLNPAIFSDNCNIPNELIIHWQLELDQNPTTITGIGQPSSYETAIVIPGNDQNIVNHHITYWLEDKSGNITPVGDRAVVTISIRPRPPIVRDF